MQKQLEGMGVFEQNRLQEKINELEKRMDEKDAIVREFHWTAIVAFIMGLLCFIDGTVAFVAFMGMFGIFIWLRQRAEDRLRRLNDVSMTTYTIAEQKAESDR